MSAKSYEDLIHSVSVRYTDKIKQICAPLFHCLNITHFWYCKIDHRGDYSFIGSHPGWCELFAAEKLYLKYSYLRHPQFHQSSVHLIKNPKDPSLSDVLTSCKDRFSMQCLLSVINKDEDGIEEFGFASPSDSDEQISLLMNELPLLRLFVKKFWEENPFLRKKFDDHSVNIGKLIGPHFYEPFATPVNKKWLLQKMGSNINLSAGEVEVLKFMQKGLSARQISTQVFRSIRTIEHRIEKMKEKLDCLSKAELIQKASELTSFGLL